MRETLSLPVAESSQAGEARRLASAMAERAGFGEVGRGKVALIATELANNLIRHARGGELALSLIHRGPALGVEVLSIDRGPGMADFDRCLVDGYSTTSTPGNGLGAIKRFADEFDVQTVVDQGTVLVARVWGAPATVPKGPLVLETGAVCLPLAGEQECGDAWDLIELDSGKSLVMVADGLGHGRLASEASAAAIGVLRRGGWTSPVDLLHAAHEELKGTRGAAVSVAMVDLGRREVRFAGVGNVAGSVLSYDKRRGLASLNGTIGVDVRKIQEFSSPWSPGSILVMHSDGLTSQWKLERRSQMASKHPSVIAGALYRDHARDRDDSTVVVARDGGPTAG